MNRKWLALALVLTNAASSALADYAHDLQFTNLTLNASLPLAGLASNQLNAVTYGGSSNFVAVGRQQVSVRGNFTPLAAVVHQCQLEN